MVPSRLSPAMGVENLRNRIATRAGGSTVAETVVIDATTSGNMINISV